MNRTLPVLAIVAIAAASQAFTVASFQDPTIGQSNLVVFTLSGGSLSAGYTGIELNVLGTNYSNVTMTITPVTISGSGPVYNVAAGSAVFSTGSDSNVLTITWDGASLVEPFSLGGSFAAAQTVTFSGSSVPAAAATWTSRQFAFSFANQQTGPNGTTYSASMTSSAVPEPATIAVLAMSIVGLVARRRK